MDRNNLIGEIEELALGLMSIEEFAAIVEMENTALASDPELMKAYDTGLLKSRAQVWKSIQKLAASGSGPAQELALKRIQSLETKRKQYE